MRHRFSLSPTGVVVLLASLIIVGCGAGTTPSAPTTATQSPQAGGEATQTSQLVATVNGQPITMDSFQRELARFEAGQVALGFEVTDPAGYQQQVLDLLIEQELIRQEAARQGISVSDEAVDAEISAMIQESGQDYFNAWLASNYYTLDEFREVIRLDLLTSQLVAPIAQSVPSTAEQVHARHILVNSQAQAEEILNRLLAGEDFAALAAQYSVDVTTRANGGDLGWFPRGGLLVPEVEEVAFSLQPGQTSGVVASAWGFHIVQTLEHDPSREVAPETLQRLVEKAIEEWRLSLRNGASIQQFVSFTP